MSTLQSIFGYVSVFFCIGLVTGSTTLAANATVGFCFKTDLLLQDHSRLDEVFCVSSREELLGIASARCFIRRVFLPVSQLTMSKLCKNMFCAN